MLNILAQTLLLAGALLAAMPSARAERRPPDGSEIQLFIENDMLARTDRYYTNGIKLGVGAPFELLQGPAADLLRQLAPEDPGKVHVGLFVGQNLYTPRNIRLSAAQPFDRPWAAWLYLGGVAQRAKGDRLDTVEIDVGLIGPSALGREVQSNWHRLIGSPQPQGWHHQVPNEPGFLVSYLVKQRFRHGDWEAVPHGGVTVGTVLTMARVGGIVRYGRHMSGFGVDTIEPGGALLNNLRQVSETPREAWEWHVFAGIDHRLVARNVFLDGAFFSGGPSVTRRPHVYDISLGASWRWRAVRLSFTRVKRSEEFTGTAGGGGRQTFDSLNLGVEF